MTIQREELMELVDQTWQILFGESLEPCDALRAGGEGIRATVSIQGAWNGRVVVEFERAAVELVACRLLEAKPGELEEPEIRDAAGEISNILAGNLKSMVSQPSTIGLPRVEAADLDEMPERAENSSLFVIWQWVGTQISVRLDESNGERA